MMDEGPDYKSGFIALMIVVAVMFCIWWFLGGPPSEYRGVEVIFSDGSSQDYRGKKAQVDRSGALLIFERGGLGREVFAPGTWESYKSIRYAKEAQ